MVDKGDWDEAEYRFKIIEYKNKVEKEEIEIQKLELQKREIALKVEELDLSISKCVERKLKHFQQQQWCRDKLGEGIDVPIPSEKY